MKPTIPPLALVLMVFALPFAGLAEPSSTEGSYLVYPTNNLFCAQAKVTHGIVLTHTNAAKLLSHLIHLPQCESVTLLPGDYPMKSRITLKSDLSLTGQKGVRLLQQTGGDLFLGKNIVHTRIADLELAGRRSKLTGAAIALGDNCRSNLFTNLFIHDFAGDGISLSGSNSQYNVMSHNRIENCVGAGIGHYWAAGDAIIENNYVYRTRFHGIIVSRGGSNCRITSNTVVDAGYFVKSGDFSHGIAADGFGVVHGTGNVIVGNVISNSAMAGIEVADFQHNCLIANNQIYGTGHKHYGIYFGGGLTPSTNVMIATNIVWNADGSGIHIDSPMSGEKGVTSNVQINGNVIHDSNDDGLRIGVAANVTASGNIFQHNGRDGSGDGIHVQGRGKPSQDISLIGNRCFDDGKPPRQRFGLWLENISGGRVTGNILSPNKNGSLFEKSVNSVTVTNNF